MENTLKGSKFKRLLRQQPALLWIETGYLVIIVISVALIVGPIAGGALYEAKGIQTTGISFAVFGAVVAFLYIILNCCCAKGPEEVKDKDNRHTDTPEDLKLIDKNEKQRLSNSSYVDSVEAAFDRQKSEQQSEASEQDKAELSF